MAKSSAWQQRRQRLGGFLCVTPSFSPTESKTRLLALPLALRREIGHKLFLMEEDLAGNVKKLKGSTNEYRLRVGNYRALFALEGRTVTVYAVGNRKDICR